MLIIGILVAGIAFNTVAQSKEKKAEKAYYKRNYHEPKHQEFKSKGGFKASKTDFKSKGKKTRSVGKHKMHNDHKLKPYARRKDF